MQLTDVACLLLLWQQTNNQNPVSISRVPGLKVTFGREISAVVFDQPEQEDHDVGDGDRRSGARRSNCRKPDSEGDPEHLDKTSPDEDRQQTIDHVAPLVGRLMTNIRFIKPYNLSKCSVVLRSRARTCLFHSTLRGSWDYVYISL